MLKQSRGSPRSKSGGRGTENVIQHDMIWVELNLVNIKRNMGGADQYNLQAQDGFSRG